MSPRAASADPTADPAGIAETPSARDGDLRLARLHLRTGSLAIARAEYEALVAEGPLGPDDLADLAEVRWRTDDLPGAGDAAAAHMELGGATGRALAIAAEAASAIGRTVEAERLASRAVSRLAGSVAGFFAGMPMSDVWPPVEIGSGTGPSASTTGPIAQPLGESSAAEPRESGPPGDAELPLPVEPSVAVPQPTAELDAARVALGDGRDEVAVIRLAIVLRLDPTLAPAILEMTIGRSAPAFELLRGDAFRLVGQEADARAAYAAAQAALDVPQAMDRGPVR